MKYIDEYRDAKKARAFADALARITTRPWVLMEVCGGQTHAIVNDLPYFTESPVGHPQVTFLGG